MPARRSGFDITDEALPRRQECFGQIRRVEAMVIIVADALGGAAEQREVVGRARMRDAEGVDEQGAIRRQATDKGCPARFHDLPQGVIFQDCHDDVVGLRQDVFCSRSGLVV